MILDSTSPPNVRNWVDAPSQFARSLRLVFDQCNADAQCRQTFPELEKDFYSVLENLERTPIIITGLDNRFPEGRLVVDGTLLAAGIFQGLYDYRFIRLTPLLIREMKNRNAEVLRAIAEGLVRDSQDLNVGLQYAVDCFEMAPLSPQSEIESERRRYPELGVWHELVDEQALCKAWHDVRADSQESLPVQSDIPTLILAGEFDPITPPSYGRIAASTLTVSTFVEIPGAGHGASPTSECTKISLTFFCGLPPTIPSCSRSGFPRLIPGSWLCHGLLLDSHRPF